MAVYMITLHSYRSWNADRRHVRRDRQGIQKPNLKLATHRDQIAKQQAVELNLKERRIACEAVIEVCQNTDRKLHALTVVPNHIHILCSWTNEQLPQNAAAHFKRIVGMKLSHAKGTTGHRWFSRGQDIERIADRKHFEYLIQTYLPRHREQNGIFWQEMKPSEGM